MEADVAIPIVMLINLLLGVMAGIIMHRSDFCITGMFRDFFLFRHTHRLKALLLLIIASMVLFELARQAGLLPIYPFPVLGSPSLANLAGGLVFGIGMVLAGGCVVGTLYKMGAGSVISAVALAGIIIGSGLYAEIHPQWKSFMTATTIFNGKITVPQIIGLEPGLLIGPIAAVGAWLFYRWYRDNLWQRTTVTAGYVQPWQAAVYLSFLGGLSYILIGMPFGISTAYAKIAGYIEVLFFRDHVNSLAFFNGIPLKYTLPLTRTYLEGGAGPTFDAISAIQLPLIVGIISGAAFSAIQLREFRLYFRVPHKQYISALAGGIILGLAARLAPSCNVWHLMGGLPILAGQSILFLAGLIPGAWIGSLLLVHLVLNETTSCRCK